MLYLWVAVFIEVLLGHHHLVQSLFDTVHGVLGVGERVQHVGRSLVSLYKVDQHRGKVALQVKKTLQAYGDQVMMNKKNSRAI